MRLQQVRGRGLPGSVSSQHSTGSNWGLQLLQVVEPNHNLYGLFRTAPACQNVAALDLTADDHIAFRIDAVDLKNRLAMPRPTVVTVCMFGSSESWEPLTAPTSLALTCRCRSRPQHQKATSRGCLDGESSSSAPSDNAVKLVCCTYRRGVSQRAACAMC